MKKLKIKIESTQGMDKDTDSIIEYGLGTLKKSRDGFVLKYETGKGKEKIKTVLTVTADKTATIVRTGANNSKLIIAEGKRNECKYVSPIGTMILGILGKQVSYLLTDNGGEINLAYSIDQNKNTISRNTVNIYIKEG